MKPRLFAVTAAAAVAALVASGPGAAARSPKPRTQALEYVAGGISAGPDRTAVVTAGDNVGAVEFKGGPERFVSIEVADVHGLPVAAIVAQGEVEHHVCGSTEEALPIRPYRNVKVFVVNGLCDDAGASVVTTGTVTATFTARR